MKVPVWLYNQLEHAVEAKLLNGRTVDNVKVAVEHILEQATINDPDMVFVREETDLIIQNFIDVHGINSFGDIIDDTIFEDFSFDLTNFGDNY